MCVCFQNNSGWKYGTSLDENMKTHPLIRPFKTLIEKVLKKSQNSLFQRNSKFHAQLFINTVNTVILNRVNLFKRTNLGLGLHCFPCEAESWWYISLYLKLGLHYPRMLEFIRNSRMKLNVLCYSSLQFGVFKAIDCCVLKHI